MFSLRIHTAIHRVLRTPSFAAAGAYGWAVYSGASTVLFGVGFILFVRGCASTGRLASIRGLFQRIAIAIGWIWLSLVAAHLMGGIV
jgi:hypothetical protein